MTPEDIWALSFSVDSRNNTTGTSEAGMIFWSACGQLSAQHAHVKHDRAANPVSFRNAETSLSLVDSDNVRGHTSGIVSRCECFPFASLRIKILNRVQSRRNVASGGNAICSRSSISHKACLQMPSHTIDRRSSQNSPQPKSFSTD